MFNLGWAFKGPMCDLRQGFKASEWCAQQVLLQEVPLQYDDELPFVVWVPVAFQMLFSNLAKELIKMVGLQGRIRRHMPRLSIPNHELCCASRPGITPWESCIVQTGLCIFTLRSAGWQCSRMVWAGDFEPPAAKSVFLLLEWRCYLRTDEFLNDLEWSTL
jgi:hypothetical protein